ncbi:MAG: substrate-binding domain-containing protein [Bacteroidota bacterium]|nr:substrate-binding domain-containing protein [Bacteroidota bacterium]
MGRRSIIHFFFLVILLSLTACTKNKSTYTIGISQCSDDDWRQKMNTEMRHEALLHPGLKLVIKTVKDDTHQQINDIESFIDQKVDLLIVSPNEAAPMTPVIEKAYQSGIPVVLVDRKILSDQYTAYIAADNYQIGKEVGHYAVNLLKGKGKVFEFCGLEGSTSAIERHQGFNSVIRQYPNIKLVYQVDAAWSKKVAGEKMKEALAMHNHVDLVFAQNDRMALGAFNEAQKRGSDGIYFLGIDALPGKDGGIEQVLDNKLKATFIYPTGGDKIIQLVIKILEGKPFNKNNTLYTAVVDQTNARILKLQSDEIIEQENKIGFLNGRVDAFTTQYTLQRYLLISVSAIVVLLIVLFFFLFHAYRSKNRLNIQLEQKNDAILKQKNILEKQRDQLVLLSKQLEEATYAKLVFFTNISHEFKTPLTLISGPVSTLLSDKHMTPEQHRLLHLIHKNADILLNLLNQIIDFRKFENGKLKLNPGSHDLKQQLLDLNEAFVEMSRQKHLAFDFQVLSSADFTFSFDVEKMERIYYNLLSNAFKYTPEKGHITVSLNKIEKEIQTFAEISISNSGEGLSPEDIHHIFERFYQVDSRMAGSGIGLALVKALVELHEGDIQVISQSGKTTFIVRIPFKQTQMELEKDSEKCEMTTTLNEVVDTYRETVFEATEAQDLPTILVVDDNPDICVYIKTILQNQYTVYEAKDGEEGLRKAIKYVPDIIVSDVMMPKVDGIALCQRLKQELSTSHIPIILLTACSLVEQRITGFENGADDYISKPFNATLLQVRIRKLIENRQQLKKIFREQFFSEDDKGRLNVQDKKGFLDKFRQIIEKDISNSELSMEDLGKSIGLSRVQLYRKIKSMTDYSPNELLKIIRLKKACQLLSTTEKTISEVTYDTGFTSPSYFTKCFREFYNESPSDYLKRVRK